MSGRPLAVLMVADANPITVTNLRKLSRWADLLLMEGTRTTGGEPRVPLRDRWRSILDLDREQCRVVTTDLPSAVTKPRRSQLQRDAALPVLVGESPDRTVLQIDTDEFLTASRVQEVLSEPVPEPFRLGLVPIFGAVDRTALSMHCCWRQEVSSLREHPRPYVFPGPAVSTVAHVLRKGTTAVRFSSPLIDRHRTFGTHVTLTEAPDRVSWKLRNTRHQWSERVLDPRHLQTMLDAGVHPAGWWIAQYREPEPWLLALADEARLRVCGPLLPSSDLTALRAWAQARNNPSLPAGLVAMMDNYVSSRPHGTWDFLNTLHAEQLRRPVEHTGQQPRTR